MFDQTLDYKFVQKRSNKYFIRESFITELTYKFYRHNTRSCIKYIVSVKTYSDGLLTLDYYPKINLTAKQNSKDDIQDLRYRLLTKQNSFGIIGGTILDIMLDVQVRTNFNIWGLLAANLITEYSNANNRRYQVYKEILSRTFVYEYDIFGNKENSAIFVIPKFKRKKKKKLLNNMKKSSQRPTDIGKAVSAKKQYNDTAVHKSKSVASRSAVSGRFVGMAKNTERVDSTIIPGYKVRG